MPCDSNFLRWNVYALAEPTPALRTVGWQTDHLRVVGNVAEQAATRVRDDRGGLRRAGCAACTLTWRLVDANPWWLPR